MDELTTLVSKAAAAINAIQFSTVEKRIKLDHSPVTAADDAAQAVIAEGLARILPGIPVISEEASKPEQTSTLPGMFVLVDPLDGTREFLAGRNEFTVNVALVSERFPIFGCIAAPRFDQIWRGVVGHGAERLDLAPGEDVRMSRRKVVIRTRPLPDRNVEIAVSRSHLDPATERFVEKLSQPGRFVSGSSLKFCRIAEGLVDIYARLAPTHEWDIAAGHAIVVAAGGAVRKSNGDPLTYGQIADDFRVSAFVALGDSSAIGRVCNLMSSVELNQPRRKI